MSSKTLRHKASREAFVWVWLPGEIQPVVAGKLSVEGRLLTFNYGKSYLERSNAISLYERELPLRPGVLPLLPALTMPGCIRDAAPDAWGRRVLINRLLGKHGLDLDTNQLDELTYLLESGSDRAGALDFQRSATQFVPRGTDNVSLTELVQAAEKVEQGVPLPAELAEALQHGSAIGGARPKALIREGHKKYIAKFSSSTDTYSVVKAEFVAMRLARKVGLDVASVTLQRSAKKDVILVERFDRIPKEEDWARSSMVSALTLLELDEMMTRYASYEDLAEIIRLRFANAPASLRELFSRMVFNILCGNTDDHARNHAAFWDGKTLSLTPAYDICPQGRTGNEASQSMRIAGQDNLSRVATCVKVAHQFLLSEKEALRTVENQVETIAANWNAVCEEASLTKTDRTLLSTRQFLNSYVFEDVKLGRPKLS